MPKDVKSPLIRPLWVVGALALLVVAIAAGWRSSDGGGTSSVRPAAQAKPAPPPAPLPPRLLTPLVAENGSDARVQQPPPQANISPLAPDPAAPGAPATPLAAPVIGGDGTRPTPEEIAAFPLPPGIADGLKNPPADMLRGAQNPPPEMVKGLKTPPPWVKNKPPP